MDTERVARDLRAALEDMREERDTLSEKITQIEHVLAQLGSPVRRGPGRPKGSGAKVAGLTMVRRGPGRPRKNPIAQASAGASTPSGETPVRRGPGRPKGSKNLKKRGPGRPKGSGKKVAAKSKRRSPNWSNDAREAARNRMQKYWAERRKKPANATAS